MASHQQQEPSPPPQQQSTLLDFNAERLIGTWKQLLVIPTWNQPASATNSPAEYAWVDETAKNEIMVKNTQQIASGQIQTIMGVATCPDAKEAPNKLTVDFFSSRANAVADAEHKKKTEMNGNQEGNDTLRFRDYLRTWSTLTPALFAKWTTSSKRPNYIVYAYGHSFSWILVGSANKHHGWVLSKSTDLSCQEWNKINQTLRDVGFNRASFVATLHSAC